MLDFPCDSSLSKVLQYFNTNQFIKLFILCIIWLSYLWVNQILQAHMYAIYTAVCGKSLSLLAQILNGWSLLQKTRFYREANVKPNKNYLWGLFCFTNLSVAFISSSKNLTTSCDSKMNWAFFATLKFSSIIYLRQQ